MFAVVCEYHGKKYMPHLHITVNDTRDCGVDLMVDRCLRQRMCRSDGQELAPGTVPSSGECGKRREAGFNPLVFWVPAEPFVRVLCVFAECRACLWSKPRAVRTKGQIFWVFTDRRMG